MTASVTHRSTVASLALALLAACSGSGVVETTPRPAGATPSDLAAIEKARADSARYPYTAADIEFITGMISHHAQAIKMAEWAPTHGASPAVRVLADRVINAQQDEIALMQQWLRDRRQPVPEPDPKGMKMVMGGAEHHMLMPGMLTDAQMTQLDQTRGREFDKLFLTLMIQHHRGAVSMVDKLFGTYGAGQDGVVWKLASDVNIDQLTEITRMEKLLFAIITTPP